MARFLNDVSASYNEEKGIWTLTRKLAYESDIVGTVSVPKGFSTDFASVPRLPLAYLFAGNTAHSAAVVHDYLLTKGFHRPTADYVFLEAMKATNVPTWRRYLMFLAVRAYGLLT